MAETMILDELSNKWKGNIDDNEVYLEEKLKEEVSNN